MKKTKKSKTVEVNKHDNKCEVIIRHKNERVRVLCDDDGIHTGEIVGRV